MLRAVLLGLLVVSSACSKSPTESAGAKAQPGVVAGKVLEAKGSVQVKHGDATKPLATGDSVEGDDTVITGADGSVVIELAHNSARWELGANKQQKVRESIAWKATKATAEEIDQATAAAGRPAERNAAGTVAMADEEAAPAAPEAAPAPGGGQVAKADDMTPKGNDAPVERKRVRRAPAAATAEAAPPPPVETDDDEEPRPRTTRGAIKKSADSAAAASAPAAMETAPAKESVADASGGAPTADAKPRVMARSVDPIAGLLASKGDALSTCVKTHGASEAVTLTVEVTDGKATVKLSSKAAVSAALDKCIKGVVGGISFSGSGKTTRSIAP